MIANPSSAACSIVFVAGSLRSGSTLMRLMLDRHSRIANPEPGEFDFLFDALGTDGGLAAAQALGAQELDDFMATNMGALALGRPFPSAGSTAERLREFVAGHAGEADWLALSVHRNFVSAHEIFPQARFVHLLRDPRDCAKSSVAIGFAGNVYHGLEPWMQAEESWERLKGRLQPSQFIEVRYEELVAEPEKELTRVCEFIGLRFERGMLDLSGTTYESPSPKYANQWRRSMELRDIRLVEARAAHLMEARGYEPMEGAGRIDKATLLALSLQNTLRRHRDGIRLYGAALWVEEIVARRLGLRHWLQTIRQRMFPIRARTLK
jgi:hypothetical protein